MTGSSSERKRTRPTKKHNYEEVYVGGEIDPNKLSAQPCGCDPGAGWTCSVHQTGKSYAGTMGDFATFPAGRATICELMPAKGQKPTNPKQPIGSNKIPFHLWPSIASAYGALGMTDGALKYGRSNFRAAGVKASIYIDAAERHLKAWFEGEEYAPDSGVPHLGHALACIAIILDARAAGNFVDDRMYPGGYLQEIEKLSEVVAMLREKHKDKTPKHFTIQDAGQTLLQDPKEGR